MFEGFSSCPLELSIVGLSSASSRLGKGMLDISAFDTEGGVKNGVVILTGSTGDGSLFACANSRDREDGPAPMLEAVVALGLVGIAVMPSRISGSSSCFGCKGINDASGGDCEIAAESRQDSICASPGRVGIDVPRVVLGRFVGFGVFKVQSSTSSI